MITQHMYTRIQMKFKHTNKKKVNEDELKIITRPEEAFEIKQER